MEATILLVSEDPSGITHPVAFLLRQEGYLVAQAVNGVGTFEQLSKMASMPALIIVDQTNGAVAELVETLREPGSPTADVPVVLMIGNRDYTLPPADAVLYKPFPFEDLIATLQRLIK